MPKIILIQPSQYEPDGETLCKQKRIFLSGLALPLLAALVPENWQVKIINEIIDDVDFDEECDIVGLGSMGYSVARAFEIASEFKKRGRIIILGGLVAPFISEDMLNVIDSVVIGPGEISFPQLLKDYESTGKVNTHYYNPLNSIKQLPVPRYDLLPLEKISLMLPVQSSRGCPHKCDFCSTSGVYKGKYFTRPVDEVMDDIKAIMALGYKRFFLLDDNMGGDVKHLRELISRIKELKISWSAQCTINLAHDELLLDKLYRSGCHILSMGVESITQDSVDRLNKGWLRINRSPDLIRRFRGKGFIVFASFLIGTDSDTEESLRETVTYIIRNKIAIPILNILTPLPGTDLFNQLKAENRLLTENIFKYTGFGCVHEPKQISAERLDELFWWMYDEVYSYRNIIRRILLTTQAIRNPLASFFALYVNIHYRQYIKKRIGPLIV